MTFEKEFFKVAKICARYQSKLNEIEKLLKKIDNMNSGDYNFYARTELRHCYEDLLKWREELAKEGLIT